MNEVQSVTRQALSEVRDAVQGYRRLAFADALDGARAALSAAGVDCRVEDRAAELPADVENVLAWAVREATTNVVRHSGARACSITLSVDAEDVALQVEDDGAEPERKRRRHRAGRSRRARTTPPGNPRGRRQARGRLSSSAHSSPASGMIRVLIAEDQAMVRGALASLLALEDDIEVVAEVGRGDAVLDTARARRRRRCPARHRDARRRRHLGSGGARPRAARDPLADPDHVRPSRLPSARDRERRRRLPAQGRARGAARRRHPRGGRRPPGDRPRPGCRGDRRRRQPSHRARARRPRRRERARDGRGDRRSAHLSEGTVRNYLSAAIRKLGARNRAEALRIAEEKGWL